MLRRQMCDARVGGMLIVVLTAVAHSSYKVGDISLAAFQASRCLGS